MEKGTIEVIEVLVPTLSRARITSEGDYIRDGISEGDLLYNAVWRKGVADRIALAGIFDTNGDGTDDIVKVVRDLKRNGSHRRRLLRSQQAAMGRRDQRADSLPRRRPIPGSVVHAIRIATRRRS